MIISSFFEQVFSTMKINLRKNRFRITNQYLQAISEGFYSKLELNNLFVLNKIMDNTLNN